MIIGIKLIKVKGEFYFLTIVRWILRKEKSEQVYNIYSND
jgi:hypothetical protein